MWSLAEFCFDEGIEAVEVDLLLDELEPMTLGQALEIARAGETNVIARWPGDRDRPSCVLSKVTLPVRWEQADARPEEIDERLWFQASCGSRDYIVGNGHTFRGRMAAWCPHRRVGYNISLSELTEMSTESQYFVKGYLAGTEPGLPMDIQGDTSPEDERAWRAATARFRRTGSWYGRWGTCEECGCVLLPDSGAVRCSEHPLTNLRVDR